MDVVERVSPGHARKCLAGVCSVALVAIGVLGTAPAAAIESMSLPTVEGLPAELDRSFPCGQWSAGGAEGYYRVVIVSVYGGAGSETYLQRIKPLNGTGEQGLALAGTVAIAELNNDHGQYSITSARCRGKGRSAFAELVAGYEHDTGTVERIIRIELKPPYRVTNRRVSAADAARAAR